MRQNIRSRGTGCELRLRRQFLAIGAHPHHNWGAPELDFAFVNARVGVQVDGCFWHNCPIHGKTPTRNAAWWRAKWEHNAWCDRRSDETWHRRGWIVLRHWEHENMAAVAHAAWEIVKGRTHEDRLG